MLAENTCKELCHMLAQVLNTTQRRSLQSIHGSHLQPLAVGLKRLIAPLGFIWQDIACLQITDRAM